MTHAWTPDSWRLLRALQQPEYPDAGALERALDERLPLRTGLGAALAGVIGWAQAMVAECEADPVRAVHEYRKAMRRARAVVRLARPLLRPACYQELVGELRMALRGTSPLRDSAVLLGALEKLPVTRATQVPIAALRRLLQAEAAASRDGERAVRELSRSVQVVLPLPQRLSAWLPDDVRWRDVRAALAKSYRRARAARARARKTGEDAAVHSFRKRVKELRYQLELLDTAADGKPRREQHELAALAESLGEVTDLVVLRRALRLRQAELAPTRPLRLLAALDADIARRIGLLMKQSKPAFKIRPGTFAAHAVRPFR